MTATRTARDATLLQLPFPLIGGGLAMLHVPIPLTRENYDYLVRMLAATLEGMKDAIVIDPEPLRA